MVEVKVLSSDKLSTFRTQHRFLNYASFDSAETFSALCNWAVARDLPVFILGNGSNTLFTRGKVRTLVLKNAIPEKITPIGGDLFEITSSTQVMRVLKYCEKDSRASLYFLASVPATIGGAIAMNAGGGSGATIFDFLEELTYIDGQEIVTLKREDIEIAHRQTMFTGIQTKLILKAVFRFPKIEMTESLIRKRAHWARDNQDLASPNCGSVFRSAHRPLLALFRFFPPWGINTPGFRTQYSRRVNNWIITRSASPWPIVFLIRFVQLAHKLIGKRAQTEIVEVS